MRIGGMGLQIHNRLVTACMIERTMHLPITTLIFVVNLLFNIFLTTPIILELAGEWPVFTLNFMSSNNLLFNIFLVTPINLKFAAEWQPQVLDKFT